MVFVCLSTLWAPCLMSIHSFALKSDMYGVRRQDNEYLD